MTACSSYQNKISANFVDYSLFLNGAGFYHINSEELSLHIRSSFPSRFENQQQNKYTCPVSPLLVLEIRVGTKIFKKIT